MYTNQHSNFEQEVLSMRNIYIYIYIYIYIQTKQYTYLTNCISSFI